MFTSGGLGLGLGLKNLVLFTSLVRLDTHLRAVWHNFSRAVRVSIVYSQLGYLLCTRLAVCIDTSLARTAAEKPVSDSQYWTANAMLTGHGRQ